MVTKLDRLARSSRDLHNILHELAEAGCGFVSLSESWCDTTTDVGRLITTIMGGLYEFERGLIRKRCDEGIARAKALGSRATAEAVPKDVDLLVTVELAIDLAPLARAGRRLQGLAQTINLGADIFLADSAGRYLGRICHYRESIHVSHATPSIAGLETNSTTIFTS